MKALSLESNLILFWVTRNECDWISDKLKVSKRRVWDTICNMNIKSLAYIFKQEEDSKEFLRLTSYRMIASSRSTLERSPSEKEIHSE